MIRRARPALLSIAAVAVLGTFSLALPACQGDPNLPETWIKKLDAKSKKERLEAVDRLRKLGDAKAVPALIPLLKDGGELKSDVAKALGALKDPSAVQPLIDAIDLGVGAGTDRDSKAMNDANKEIAIALSDLGSKEAVQPLANLAARTKDNFVRVEAINALGSLGDPRAVETLAKIATDETMETFVNKKAIQALGNIGDPAATPAIVKMLFHERRGVSFYAESSFAVYQIGPAAAPPLLEILDGKNVELKKWCDEHDIFHEATYAKAAQVLGDLGEKKAVPSLQKYLNYNHEDLLRKLLVRMQAADALGRLRIDAAAELIAKQLDEEEGNVRATYTRALVMIGDKAVVPQLIACATKGDPMDDDSIARKACYDALSKLGEEKALAQWEAWEKAEPKLSEDACLKGVEFDDDKGKENAAAHCKKLAEKIVKILADGKSRVAVYGECKQDAACWVKKLKDADPKVRERAAFELGRIGQASSMDALVEAMSDQDNEARYAAILAADWIISSGKEGLAAAKKHLGRLDEQIARESGKVHFVKINEDIKRLTVKIRRLDKGA